MFRRIWALLAKEFIQTLRDRRTLLIQIGLPIIQLTIFGYAIRMNVEHVPTAIADQSLDPASHAYVQAMVNSGYFDAVVYVADQEAVVRTIDEGRAQAGIVIPPGFQAAVTRREAQALLLVDGSDVFTSQTAYRAITAIAEQHATDLMIARLERDGQLRSGERILPIDARVRILYNPNLDDLWFLIPGMVATILQT
jgi:ABC-2 type transport system permease protein